MSDLMVQLSEKDLGYLVEALESLLDEKGIHGNRRWQVRARADLVELRDRLNDKLGQFED